MNLRVSHVDLKATQPCLVLTKDIVKGKKKGRTVPLCGAFIQALFARLVAAAGKDGRVFTCGFINRSLKRACIKAGVGHLSQHSLRHYFATRMMEATNMNAKVVAEWLGHRDGGKLVWTLYSHARRSVSSALAQAINLAAPVVTVIPAAA